MTVIGINGSPRKNWNTGTLVAKALEGAASTGAKTELLHLYDLSFKGCTSCFACKTIGSPSNGRCAYQDGLSPILKKIEAEADAIIVGSPIYFGNTTGETRCFMERLLFPSLVYSNPPRCVFPRAIRSGLIYTMNVSEEVSAECGYQALFRATEEWYRRVFGSAETFCSYDTYQFPDYSKVVMEYMDPVKKSERRKNVFPEDCRTAFEFGRRLADASPR